MLSSLTSIIIIIISLHWIGCRSTKSFLFNNTTNSCSVNIKMTNNENPHKKKKKKSQPSNFKSNQVQLIKFTEHHVVKPNKHYDHYNQFALNRASKCKIVSFQWDRKLLQSIYKWRTMRNPSKKKKQKSPHPETLRVNRFIGNISSIMVRTAGISGWNRRA